MAHIARLSTMGEMATGIAHEVNQPLSVIANYAEAGLNRIRSGLASPEELGRDLERIVRQSERAAQIIRRIRNFTQKQPIRATIDLNDAVRAATELLASTARRLRTTIRVELAEVPPRVLADQVQLEQVLINLAQNGMQAMREALRGPRELLISTSRPRPGWLQATVRDWGPGVAPEVRNELFKPFFTTKSDGLGMGLSISRSIVEAHGGRLWVEDAEGGGAAFCFEIPEHGDVQ